MKHWKEFRPRTYQELEDSGELDDALDSAVLNTMKALEQTEAQLLASRPRPDDFMERIRYHQWARQTAWELIREQWILLPPEAGWEESQEE